MSGVGLEVLLEGLIPEIAYSGEKGQSHARSWSFSKPLIQTLYHSHGGAMVVMYRYFFHDSYLENCLFEINCHSCNRSSGASKDASVKVITY